MSAHNRFNLIDGQMVSDASGEWVRYDIAQEVIGRLIGALRYIQRAPGTAWIVEDAIKNVADLMPKEATA